MRIVNVGNLLSTENPGFLRPVLVLDKGDEGFVTAEMLIRELLQSLLVGEPVTDVSISKFMP